MNGDVMPNSDVVADVCGTCLMGHVNTTPVLYVCAVANRNWSHVASDDGVEPNRTLVAHRYIAHNRGVLAEIAVLAPFGCQTAITLN